MHGGVDYMTKSDKGRKIILYGIGIVLILGIYGCYTQNTSDFETNEKIAESIQNTSDFKITGNIDESNVEISYISVVYIDGYAYELSEWYADSRNEKFTDVKYIKGNKIGQTTLDLKGKIYEGTPPDFSTTYPLGADLYEIEGFKKEYAILIESDDVSDILYRVGKAVTNKDESIGLKVDDVINMISDNANVKSLELRSETDASLVRTSYDNELIELIYKDIKSKDIYRYEELNNHDDLTGLRIPINLVLEEGAMLHMQVYPESNTAYIFGGYIDVSDDLSNRLLYLYN